MILNATNSYLLDPHRLDHAIATAGGVRVVAMLYKHRGAAVSTIRAIQRRTRLGQPVARWAVGRLALACGVSHKTLWADEQWQSGLNGRHGAALTIEQVADPARLAPITGALTLDDELAIAQAQRLVDARHAQIEHDFVAEIQDGVIDHSYEAEVIEFATVDGPSWQE